MSIVIDANQFSNFMNSKNDLEDLDFRPVYEWIRFGKGKIVYGGSKYREEVKARKDFGAFLFQMEHVGKAVGVKTEDVDSIEDVLERRYKRHDFDDHHIVSILLISECKLVLSQDNGLHDLIDECFGQNSRRFMNSLCPQRDLTKPKIYQNRNHRSLLRDENAVACKRSIRQ